ncbi:MAG: amylo-alpha-1,6-glucosidase [Leptolyngbyaceae bacterium]|nr:amylo-alpha-1,6-glucosidase [Leptolyngbyaceae bacterium]
MPLQFGREICGDLHTAEQREWLVTNGIGGYACGTVPGILTRHYHGILIAALEPPVGRMLMVAKLDESAIYRNQIYALCANRWADGIVNPEGHHYLEQFYLDGSVPTWRYVFSDAVLMKQIWMAQGENTTYVRYTLNRGSNAVLLNVKALVNYRNHHGGLTLGNWAILPIKPPEADGSDSEPPQPSQIVKKTSKNVGVKLTAFYGAIPFYIRVDKGSVTPESHWYHNFDLAVEHRRGTGESEDHLHGATVKLTLSQGESATVVVSTNPDASLDGETALGDRHAYDHSLLNSWNASNSSSSEPSPDWIQQLVFAADQFIVERPLAKEADGKTIIAGYPWFNDWGRDTMVSLPGLTIATGRPQIARPILRTFARYLNRGMLPNLFPDRGNTPDYNTADAVLWYFEAIRAYDAATQEDTLLAELYPALEEVIEWHRNGTRYNIHLDAEDGLLYAGEPGMQLTWMDVKIGDWVVTPRMGKPIEVNALWYNALKTMSQFSIRLGKPTARYDEMAEQTREGFQKFWNPVSRYCYDVIDTPTGPDEAFRPNQVFAVSLPFKDAHDQAPLLKPDQQKSVVNALGRELLTSYGLRSLSTTDPDYRRYYQGGQAERDAAYHQGTVWSWLLGAYVQAHLRVYHSPAQARDLLGAIANHLSTAGLGTISEIFDGEPPHYHRGCIAQAWSVAEILRAWKTIENFDNPE